MQVRTATIEDLPQVLGLYRRVAATPGGLARLVDEIDDSYIHFFLSRAIDNGLTLVAIDNFGEISGEIHAYSPNLYCFSHVFSDLTIVVDPEHQGKGIGRLLFTQFLATVTEEYFYIKRVELIARESNEAAIRFYESLGFSVEGKMKSRIRNVDGTLEADIPMAWIRVNGVMREYYKNPEATAQTLKHGWLYTGDIAKKDKDGFFHLVDRKKDVIITGGENVFPVEVEHFVYTHPSVKDTAAIGFPDQRLGEIVAIVIEVVPGKKLTQKEIFLYCETLPRYKRPRKVFFGEIPCNPTGKIEKPKLRKRYIGREKAFELV